MNTTTITTEPTAASSTGTSFVVPYSKLFLSAGNARRSKPTVEGIRQLAEMIDRAGLLNALHVTAETKDGKPTGRFGVEAGGRRWRALGLLVADGRYHPDALIECKEVRADAAMTVSLSENLAQEPMHAADEFEAYARLAKDGKRIELIAAQFGVTVQHVQRRMLLAAVAPALLQLFREGKATLDQMMALASVSDQKRQLAVWKMLPEYSRGPTSIKNKLTENEVRSDDDRVKLVTLARYAACGGTTRLDLFNDHEYLSDPGLVDLLVAEVLEERAAKLRNEGWAWVETCMEYGYQERQRFHEPAPKYLQPTPAFLTQRAALHQKMDKVNADLEAEYENEDDDASIASREALEAESQRLQKECEALQRTLIDPAGHDKSASGAVVAHLGGKVVVMRGLLTAEAAKAQHQQSRRALSALAGNGSGSGNGSGDGEAPSQAVPEKLMANLTSHRTAALQATLVSHQHAALAALTARLASQAIGGHRAMSGVKINLTTCEASLKRDASAFADSRAAQVLQTEGARWRAELPQDDDRWFAWLLAQPQETVLALLAFVVAHSIDTVQTSVRSNGASETADELSAAVQLDMANWWTATPETYFDLVPKARLIDAVTEAAGAEAAKDLGKLKKDEAVRHTAAQLDGKRWLPVPLRRIAADVGESST